MRELERHPPSSLGALTQRVAIVGAGRFGTVLTAALREAGVAVDGPLRRGELPEPVDVVLLCVGDDDIPAAAAAIAPGPLVGHCSGATGLQALGDRRAFSLHPLMTVTSDDGPGVLRGAAAAIDGSDGEALDVARALAGAAGLRALRVAPEDRPIYHAAASVAANHLVTVLGSAERIGAQAGLERGQLVGLVRAAVDNWAAIGAERALTGPVARGDEATVARQREAVARRAPAEITLFDALTAATRELAFRARAAAPRGGARPGDASRPESLPC